MGQCKESSNIQLTLGIWWGILTQQPLPPATHQPHLLIQSAKTINHKKSKEPKNKIEHSTNRLILPWSTYREPSAMRGRLGAQP